MGDEKDVKEDNTADINLSSRGLTQLTEDFVTKFGSTCKRLDLTDNEIKSGAYFDRLTALEVLVLDKNNIETLDGWPVMKNVTTLWLNNNKISDNTAMMDFLSKTFPNLAYLSMMKNPACPNMYFSDGEAEAYQRYRYYIIHRLKKLKFLDATPIDANERKEAEKRGAFSTVAKPKNVPKVAEQPTTTPTTPEPKKREVKEHTPKTSTFLAKGRARYDGANSEGNRFIGNDEL